MISNPPTDVSFLNESSEMSSFWHDWFEDVQQEVNEGEIPTDTYNIDATLGVLIPMPTNDLNIRMQSSTGGNTNITKNPQIEPGKFDGQRITAEGMDDIRTVQFDDGNGLKLIGGASATLKNSDLINFHWNAGKQLWIENYRAIS